jgi:hypothetical protein
MSISSSGLPSAAVRGKYGRFSYPHPAPLGSGAPTFASKLLRFRFQQSLSRLSAFRIPKTKLTLRRSAFRPLWQPSRPLWLLLRLRAPRTSRTLRKPLPLVANLRGNCRQFRLPQLRPRPPPFHPLRLLRAHSPPLGFLRPPSPLLRNSLPSYLTHGLLCDISGPPPTL